MSYLSCAPGGQLSVIRAWTLLPIVEEDDMRNKDEMKGRSEQIKGKVKQATGDLTDDERLREEGLADEASGEARETLGRARRKVGEAIEDLGEDIKR